MKKKTLLLCFIHGFKGDDGTFDQFPKDLRVLVNNAFPHLDVRTLVYPRYETRGDLASSVARFREWLQTHVIDLEVAAGTPSPVIEPSVRTILVAHSMGGIVAADALLSILDDESVTLSGRTHRKGAGFMFPYIQGILAFDTPYLGLSPEIFTNGVDTHLRTASTAISSILASGFLAGKAASEGSNVAQAKTNAKEARKRSRSSSSGSKHRSSSRSSSRYKEPVAPPAPAVPSGLFGGWGRAMAYAGAASLLATAGAVAYFKPDGLTQTYTWVYSHMEFVGALMKDEELRTRLQRATAVPGVGFADFYTALGERGMEKGARTFIILPSADSKHWKLFHRCVNPRVKDEVEAHVSMFSPKSNPWYYEMSQTARDQIVDWVKGDWSEELVVRRKGSPERTQGPGRGERL